MKKTLIKKLIKQADKSVATLKGSHNPNVEQVYYQKLAEKSLLEDILSALNGDDTFLKIRLQ